VLTATRQFVVKTDDVGCRLFDDVVDNDAIDFCDDVTGACGCEEEQDPAFETEIENH